MNARLILRQFVQYVLVGGVAFVVDFAALFLLTEKLGLYYLVSASLAFLLGLITNYLLCITWIFKQHKLSKRSHEFIVFAVIGLLGLLFNNVLMFGFTELLGFHYLWSKAASATLILLFNFALRRTILFGATSRPP